MKNLRLPGILLVLHLAPAGLMAQLTVNDVGIFNFDGGEIQSTVIPPGVKKECPNGRVLISRDTHRAPATGAVVSRDIGQPGMPPIEATFDSIPKDCWAGNDHDLVVLPNGDVLYVSVVSSKRPANPKPGWYDITFRDGFGPGARTGMVTWRSTDGGKSFQYLSEYDPVNYEGGVPAFPQVRTDAKGKAIWQAPWDMGGSDGPLVKVIPGTDTLLMTWEVVGFHPRKGITPFTIDSNNRIQKSMLLMSKAGGPWTSLGMEMDGTLWRNGMVPFTSGAHAGKVVFSGLAVLGNIPAGAVFTGRKNKSTGKFSYEPFQLPPQGFKYLLRADTGSPFYPFVYANVSANTVLARVGNSNQVVMAYPGVMSNNGNGCHVYFYDLDANKFNPAAPIIPEDVSGGYIMHPTLVESKGGPLLLYWYDMNSKTMTAKIRGRMITGPGQTTDDFDISKSAGKPYAFSLKHFDPATPTKPEAYWYGDYHTAYGYLEPTKSSITAFKKTRTSQFFPVWVQPDGTLRYAQVTYKQDVSAPVVQGPVKDGNLSIHVVSPRDWKIPSTIPPREWRMKMATLLPGGRIESKDMERMERNPR